MQVELVNVMVDGDRRMSKRRTRMGHDTFPRPRLIRESVKIENSEK